MVGGGSHKANARLARSLVALQIPHELQGRYFPREGAKSFWSSKRVVYRIHADYVMLARKLGMTVLSRKTKL